MRTMNINKSDFYYALYKGKLEKTDEYGNATGEYEIIRDNPKLFQGNISSAKGETNTLLFGENENYDKVVVIGNDSPLIDEYAVLWVDRVPLLTKEGKLETDSDGNVLTPHDYIVKKVAKSLNSKSIAISKVNVT